jgi:hypothetical protein
MLEGMGTGPQNAEPQEEAVLLRMRTNGSFQFRDTRRFLPPTLRWVYVHYLFMVRGMLPLYAEFRQYADESQGYCEVDGDDERTQYGRHAELGGHSHASHNPGSLFLTLPTRGSTG